MTQPQTSSKQNPDVFRLAREAYGLDDGALGRIILELSRMVRLELSGQTGGLPNLTRYNGTSYEGVLVWELMPEIARRLIETTGVVMLKTKEEAKTHGFGMASNADLRISLGEVLRMSNFGSCAGILRGNPGLAPINMGDVYVCEILDTAVEFGNLLEIAVSRLPGNHDLLPEQVEQDHMGSRIAHLTSIFPYVAKSTSWTPELGQALSDFDVSAPRLVGSFVITAADLEPEPTEDNVYQF